MTTDNSPKMVKLSSVVMNASAIMAVVFVGSLLMWLLSWPASQFPLINPFVSMLGLVACPFFYVMGKRVDAQ